MKQIFLIIAIAFILTSCAAMDPAANDLNSPCVSNGKGFGEKVPCERRSPIENFIV